MAISVTSLGSTVGASGSTIALSGLTVPAGALIVVAVSEFSTSATGGSCADGASNSYAIPAGAQVRETNGNTLVTIFRAYNVSALSGQSITYTRQTSGSQVFLAALYATGIQASSDPVDSAVTASTTGVASTWAPNLTSGTPSVAGELFVAAIGGQGNGSFTFTQDGSWTTPTSWSGQSNPGANSNADFGGGYLVNAGTGTKNWNPSVAVGTSRGFAAIIVGFKPPAIFSVSVSESGSAADAPSVAATYPVSLSEAGTATDDTNGGQPYSASVVESGAAADAPSVIAAFAASVTESGTAVDTETAIVGFNKSVTEAASATDTADAVGNAAPVIRATKPSLVKLRSVSPSLRQ